jgi:hypothetical protein
LSAWEIHVALHLDLYVRDCFAELVSHFSGNRAAAREREIDLLDSLIVSDIDRASRLEGPPLTVLQGDEAPLGRRNDVSTRRQIRELVSPLRIRGHDSADRNFR